MELKCNQIVKLQNGTVGVVTCFNGTPEFIIFKAYCNPIKGRYNDKLENKNHNYDIVAIYDGSSVTDVKTVFKNNFNVDELPVVWVRE